jgi:polyhydroxybutyrate depolymerase
MVSLFLTMLAGRELPAAGNVGVPGDAKASLAPGDYEFQVEHAGQKRYYLVHVPPGGTGGDPRPVVLAFHGGGGDAKGMRRSYGIDRVADRGGFLAVFPEGSGRLDRKLLTWNAGTCCGYAKDRGVDDVGYVAALLTDLAHRTPVDPTRIYATGHSNGAMMSYRLAAEMSERIAAIAPVAGGMVIASPHPRRPVPILHIQSVDDPRALYEGGLGPPFPLTRTRVLHPSTPETIRWWVQHNGCPSQPRIGEVLRGAPGSADTSHTAQRVLYGPCREGSEVTLLRLTGAGHGWPGAAPLLPERIIGPATSIIDASEELWKFLRRFSRPDAPPLR